MRTDLGLWNTPKNHKWKGEYTKENEMKVMKELYHQEYTYQKPYVQELRFPIQEQRIRLGC